MVGQQPKITGKRPFAASPQNRGEQAKHQPNGAYTQECDFVIGSNINVQKSERTQHGENRCQITNGDPAIDPLLYGIGQFIFPQGAGYGAV